MMQLLNRLYLLARLVRIAALLFVVATLALLGVGLMKYVPKQLVFVAHQVLALLAEVARLLEIE